MDGESVAWLGSRAALGSWLLYASLGLVGCVAPWEASEGSVQTQVFALVMLIGRLIWSLIDVAS